MIEQKKNEFLIFSFDPRKKVTKVTFFIKTSVALEPQGFALFCKRLHLGNIKVTKLPFL
jgi:hypothetical protein